MSSLTHEDLQRFKVFLVDPQPASRWLPNNGASILATWRPFNGLLSPANQHW
ncbi:MULTISPECIES: hypothetical protein [Burkholderiaceae]|uniref:hypothetical protein n=1 Tax=Burkholderiaceae TaxID=119060 RepID=UPI00147A5608|nr:MULTISPECIES: hypothetical protein [Burkholderiaceae]MCF2134513.1 hypothetical protein [Mycetohabitans sp. B3]MCG1040545.1 hypothetical protein [Mycetohabitans sp. B7]